MQIAKQDTKKEKKHLKEVKHQSEAKSWTPKATKDVVSCFDNYSICMHIIDLDCKLFVMNKELYINCNPFFDKMS